VKRGAHVLGEPVLLDFLEFTPRFLKLALNESWEVDEVEINVF
jgi:hypothetical protein